MRIKAKRGTIFVGISAAILTLLAGAGYWYVFIAGAPQIDRPQTNVEGGSITFRLETFDSQAMGQVRQYGVILPPGYNQNPNKRYPVIFLLHGGHDDARAWVDKIGIIPVLAQLYKSNKLPPSIVITPDGNDKRGSSPLWDPNYYDGPNGKVGTLIGEEIPSVIKSRYRTLEQPAFWAMGGLSSGGWGALNIGLRHLNNFNIFFSQIGYFKDDSGPQNSPQIFVKDIPPEQRKAIRIYLDAGLNDLAGGEFLNSSRQFHEILDQLGIKNVFYTYPGGHGLSGPDYGWNYDHKHAADSLSYVGKNFRSAMEEQTGKKPVKLHPLVDELFKLN
ncbi:esterase family protein [Aetokthonos hydrillicola Thurmond2011]|jgi:enterochelin esterase-like enzyme|uniref:Esterase family protein n=1 Tax=Aetokthonos hydrillicola Thurmond2011 TaxID=2712845 RepID=A0AAP5M8U6_9CYAN|nr:alpha/beta hydrolase-fold protein [Aetokthonos hydrillicola]MBW4585281.1 esterase family protein [Aetokthonos hydrillicola CCALA 1050]MDR9896585.1 esterase family protein [Aetokthonos hydrillicola Thurmond2011]